MKTVEKTCKAHLCGKRLDLLEVGGSGLMLPLYPDHFNITGVDISHGMLAKAHQRREKLTNKNITLHHIDGEHSHLPSQGFDHVVLPYVYSVTPNPDHLISECFRLCKDGGSIWILNHFSGFGNIWDLIGIMVKSLSEWIDSDPTFRMKSMSPQNHGTSKKFIKPIFLVFHAS